MPFQNWCKKNKTGHKLFFMTGMVANVWLRSNWSQFVCILLKMFELVAKKSQRLNWSLINQGSNWSQKYTGLNWSQFLYQIQIGRNFYREVDLVANNTGGFKLVAKNITMRFALVANNFIKSKLSQIIVWVQFGR